MSLLTQLTEDKLESVRTLLPSCLHLETVCAYMGITAGTMRNWLQRGKAEIERREQGGRARKREELFVRFWKTFQQARAEGEIADSATVKQASLTNWRAAAWRLERAFPERWSPDRQVLRTLVHRVTQLESQQDEIEEQ